MKLVFFSLLMFFIEFCAASEAPDCSGRDRWPANGAFVFLKNSGVTSNEKVDFSKTEIMRMASEKVGKDKMSKEDLYNQVYHITFFEKNGNKISVITRSDATETECSMGKVDVYLISTQSE
jgi:hypothetical protein